MFTFSVSLAVLLSAVLLIFFSENKLQVEANQCYSNSDCGYYYYCCKQRYYYQSHVCGYGGCVGQPCSLDSNCGGPGECCRSYYCTKSGCTTTARPYGCSSNSDCGYNYYCCKKRYYYESHVCSYGDCLGESCSSDSDCGGPDECCSSRNRCKRSSCAQFPSWFIPVIVVSAVVFIAIVVGCCYGLIRASHRRAQVGVVVGQQQPRPTVIALQNTQSGHALPPHPSVYLNQAQNLPQPQAQAQVPPAYKHDML